MTPFTSEELARLATEPRNGRWVATLYAAVKSEREACALAGAEAVKHSQQTTDECREAVAAAIRARGGER